MTEEEEKERELQEKEEKRLERNRKARERYWQNRLAMHTNLGKRIERKQEVL